MGEALIDRESRRWIQVLLVLLAVPGLILLLRDVGRPSRDTVLTQVDRWERHVETAATRFMVDPKLICAVIAVESKGDPDARSRVGALGLMQLMPATGKEWAEKIGIEGVDEAGLLDPETNILVGTAYLRAQIESFEKDLVLALAAYNAGPGNVRKWIRKDPDQPGPEIVERHGFAETRAYVEHVLGYLAHLRRNTPAEEP